MWNELSPSWKPSSSTRWLKRTGIRESLSHLVGIFYATGESERWWCFLTEEGENESLPPLNRPFEHKFTLRHGVIREHYFSTNELKYREEVDSDGLMFRIVAGDAMRN